MGNEHWHGMSTWKPQYIDCQVALLEWAAMWFRRSLKDVLVTFLGWQRGLRRATRRNYIARRLCCCKTASLVCALRCASTGVTMRANRRSLAERMESMSS